LTTQNLTFEARERRPLRLQAALALLLLCVPARGLAQETALSGYMDFHYNNEQFADGRLDFHRFVLLVTHRFSDRIRFVGELEVEHAFVEGLERSGEVELEQAYVDFLFSRSFNVRAGMLLLPIGIINQRHEPPTYYGVERPFFDTFIIPTTWFEAGAGVHGELGSGWRYQAYIAAPLNAAKFNADDGIREGRQKGSDANASRLAATGRLEYVGIRGLTAGASFFVGDSGFEFRPRFDVPVKLFDLDARYSRDRLELRGAFGYISIQNAGELNDSAFRLSGVNPNVASGMLGNYLEAGYRFFSSRRLGEVGAFVRHDVFDTQYRMPAGYLPLNEFNRQAWVAGATYWPDPDIALKVDYVVQRNRSTTLASPNSFNVGLGWWF
jgi:hypothetical protein